MSNILIMHKGRLTDKEFNKTYKEPMKSILGSSHSLELMPVHHPQGVKKVPRAEQKEWLSSIKDTLSQFDYVLCTDPEYFKALTKQSKAEGNLGLIFETEYCKKALYLPSTQAFFFNPDKTLPQIKQCLQVVSDDISGQYSAIGSNIIHFEEYPTEPKDIEKWLNRLKQYPALTCDIEAKSLKVVEAGIYTIGFAWNKNEGICFPVDVFYKDEVRALLKEFFESYEGKLIVHKANYDIPVLNYNLFQDEDITDINNQIKGLNILCRNLDDTLIITYLATNSCAGNTLGLKDLAQPYAGQWAVDVSDVTKVNLQDLMRYNLIDCLSTWFVYETYYSKMVEDNQEQLYKEHFLPYLRDNMRCQLNGLPIDLEEVAKLKEALNQEKEQLEQELRVTQQIKNAELYIAELATIARNAKLKKKQTTVEENLAPFNFNSNDQLAVLFYEVMQLPVIEYTKNKQPSTSKGTISKLINLTDNEEYINILKGIRDLADVEKVLTAFIPAFETAHIDKYGNAHLLGYLNLCGTVSGRLSSNQP